MTELTGGYNYYRLIGILRDLVLEEECFYANLNNKNVIVFFTICSVTLMNVTKVLCVLGHRHILKTLIVNTLARPPRDTTLLKDNRVAL